VIAATWALSVPLLVPFATAMLLILAPRLGLSVAALSVGGAVLQLAAAVNLAATVSAGGAIAGAIGGWEVPVGIPLAADTLTVVMLSITAFMGVVIAVFALADIPARADRPTFHALFHALLGGASGAYLAGDLFNLYVWFEVMVIASFGLLVTGGTRAQLDAGVKYLALNLVATLSFLAAVGLIHGLAGTLTMAELPAKLAGVPAGLRDAASLLLFGALGAKAGLFPLWFWLPAAHHTPPAAVKAIFAVTLTKSGMYALIRTSTIAFPEGVIHDLILVVGILTMVLGVVLAAAQSSVHRILSAHILSQIGYVAMGLGLASPIALAGAILYMLHNIVVKANLLLIAGVARRLSGSYHLDRTGGLYAVAPLLSAMFLVSAVAMAGLPPSSGFWGKLAFVQAGIAAEMWIVVVATLGVGLFTLYSMTKIWTSGFLKPHPSGGARGEAALPSAARFLLLAPVGALTLVSLYVGLNPEPLLVLAERAAGELLDPAAYIAAVLGEQP